MRPPDVAQDSHRRQPTCRRRRNADYRTRITDIGGTPSGAGPAELAALAARETAHWGEVVRRLGIRAD
ncbi:MAG: hypothetical protein ICV73_17015 [Acetobacteraceae bacterium]|nr:hypothetical protein [Acetobacteraceae bacterium]